MKKRIIWAAFAAIALTACQRELDVQEQTVGVFTATTESTTTKTELSPDGSVFNVVWQSGDQIAIEDAAANAGVYSTTSTGTHASFTFASGKEAATAPFKAWYPAGIYNEGKPELPATQTYVAGNITGAPMYAESETPDLVFKNLGGIVRLNVSTSQEGKKVRKIVLSADKGLSGPFTITEDAAVVSGTAGITLDCGETGVAIGAESLPFHIAVPAGTYNPLKITVITTDGDVQVKTSTSGISIARSKITPITLGFGDLNATGGSAAILDGTTQPWVRLWDGGPRWAKFNVGSTIDSWAGVTEYTNPDVVGGYYSIRGRYDSVPDSYKTDDTAGFVWGSNWATPDRDQFQALLDNCDWTFCDGETVQFEAGCTLKGWKVCGKESGFTDNAIFLPLCGARDQNRSARAQMGTRGLYWTNGTGTRYFLELFAGAKNLPYHDPDHGCSVRAICVGDDVIVPGQFELYQNNVNTVPDQFNAYSGLNPKLIVQEDISQMITITRAEGDIDLNGHSVTGFYLQNTDPEKTVTIKNGTVTFGIDGKDGQSDYFGGKVLLENVNVGDGTHSAGDCVWTDGHDLTINGGTVIRIEHKKSASTPGKLTIQDGCFGEIYRYVDKYGGEDNSTIILYGGKYKIRPATGWCAPGYHIEANPDDDSATYPYRVAKGEGEPAVLVQHWPFDGNTYNAVEGGINAVVYGPVPAEDRFGHSDGAYYFDGNDKMIAAGAADFGTGSFSANVWVKSTQTGGSGNLLRTDGGYYNGWLFRFNSGRIEIWEGRSVNIAYVSGKSFADDEWHMLTYVRDVEAREGRLYADGVYLGCYKMNETTINNVTNELRFGTYGDGEYYKGAMDDPRLYTGVLTGTQIQELYNMPDTYHALDPFADWFSGPATDLSVEATANTYMVHQPGTYMFKATVKGNGGFDPITGATATPINASDINGATILWELQSAGLAIKYEAGLYQLAYKDGYVYFNTPDTFVPGDAYVAVFKDGEGGKDGQYDKDVDEILWSWLIWTTEKPAVTNKDELLIMDRNLGAVGTGNVYCRGMMYEWGRKDPFPSPNNGSYTPNTFYPDRMTAFSISDFDAEGMTVAYSVAHPTTYLKGFSSKRYWQTESEFTLNMWWSGEKTIYDPCPAGWKVPSKEEMQTVINSGVNLPGNGFIGNVSTDFGYGNPSSQYYWTSTGYDRNYAWGYHGGFTNNHVDDATRSGWSIRPVKEIPLVDLSEVQSANCYLVPEEGKYKFKATVKGNGSANHSGIDKDTDPTTIAKAELVWATFNTATAPAENELIKDIKYEDGYVFFSTGSPYKEGNALVAIKDAEGTILWSWHLWFESDDLAAKAHTYPVSNAVVMDRNLGALSNCYSADNVLDFGFAYQNGRKDPFMMTASRTSYVQVGVLGTYTSATGSSTVANSIKNPTVVFGTDEWGGDQGQWTGSDKTIFDPCPPGWHVANGGFLANQYSLFKVYENDWNTYHGLLFNEVDWYPATGDRWGSNHNNTGSTLRVWSKSSGCELASDNGGSAHGDVSNPGHGYSVRCVKE